MVSGPARVFNGILPFGKLLGFDPNSTSNQNLLLEKFSKRQNLVGPKTRTQPERLLIQEKQKDLSLNQVSRSCPAALVCCSINTMSVTIHYNPSWL